MSDAVDALLRNPNGHSAVAERAPEVTRILARSVQSGEVAPADAQYLGQLVAANTGISQPEAERRVADSFQQLKQSIDQARKASAGLALWLVVSLLIGAFIASYAATFGGRLRDSAVLASV